MLLGELCETSEARHHISNRLRRDCALLYSAEPAGAMGDQPKEVGVREQVAASITSETALLCISRNCLELREFL